MSRASTAELGILCVFARAPQLGRVKSRLARVVGKPEALSAHETLVRRCLTQVVGTAGFHVELWIAGPADHQGVVQWSTEFDIPLRQQQGGDLGARMAHALDDALARRPFAVVVGTDCPTLDSSYMIEAARVLQKCDLVLGPAEDGGYGLIGLRRSAPELFRAMPWGGRRVAAETVARASQLGFKVRLLEKLWDVDTEPDWQRFRALRFEE